MFYAIIWYVLVFLLILKLVFKLTNGICRSNTCLIGKTALITGGNSGIGYETALGLASRGCRIIIASRTSSDKLINDIYKATNNNNVVAKYLDLSSLSSIRKFASEFLASEERLDILINNSGTAGLGNVITTDGMQTVMQINHFGPFLLTHLLIPVLKKSAPSRIVFTSSMLAFTHNLSNIDNLNNPYKDQQIEKEMMTDFHIYSNSKLCNIVAAKYFARKLKGTGITSNALHPGVVSTPIYGLAFERHIPKFCSVLFYALSSFILKNAVDGAQTTLHVALSPELEHVTGKYFWDCTPFFMPPAIRNRDMVQKIIDESVRLTKLSQEEML